MEKVIELKGSQDGPTSMILVGVHGDEKCGIDALEELLPALEIVRGRVLIAYGNPHAIKQNVRFTETNLNRMFKSDDLLSEDDKKTYEYQRAQFIKPYLNQADAALDIHASHTPGSRPFIISEPKALDIVSRLPISLVVSGFDQLEPGGTDFYMNKKGGIGICVECGYLQDPATTDTAKESILSFLRMREHTEGETKKTEQLRIDMYHIHLTHTDAFVLTKPFDDFESITQGQLIGMDGEIEIRAPKNGVILFARNRDRVGAEAFLLGEVKEKNDLA